MASSRMLLATLVVLLAVLGAASAAREFSRDHELSMAPAPRASGGALIMFCFLFLFFCPTGAEESGFHRLVVF